MICPTPLLFLSSIIFYGAAQAMNTPYYLLEFSQLKLNPITPGGDNIISPSIYYEFGSFKPSAPNSFPYVRLRNVGPPSTLHQDQIFTVDPTSTIITIDHVPIWWSISPPIVKIKSRMFNNPTKTIQFAANCDGLNKTKKINEWDITTNPSQRLYFHYQCRPIQLKRYKEVLNSNTVYNGNKSIDDEFKNCYNFFYQNMANLPNDEYNNPVKYFNVPSDKTPCRYRTFYTVRPKQTITNPVECPFNGCGSVWPGDET